LASQRTFIDSGVLLAAFNADFRSPYWTHTFSR
jgi:hypothetical protein